MRSFEGLLLAGAILALSLDTSVGQISVPSRRVGFVYGQNNQVADVEIAAYLDPTCPDSLAVYPILLEVANHYQGNQLQFRMHLHNLPYHRNSHVIAKAAHVLENYAPNNNTAFSWISLTFSNLYSLHTGATTGMTDIEVLDLLSAMAHDLTGIQENVFKIRMSTYQFDLPARTDFKYGCTRGVHSTPMFTVNDIFVDATNWSVHDWKFYIDSRL